MGIGKFISDLAMINIKLWHTEDKARSEDDHIIAEAKREIDKLNQQRNNLIEDIDAAVIEELQKGKG